MKYFDKLKNKKAWAAIAAQAIKIKGSGQVPRSLLRGI